MVPSSRARVPAPRNDETLAPPQQSR